MMADIAVAGVICRRDRVGEACAAIVFAISLAGLLTVWLSMTLFNGANRLLPTLIACATILALAVIVVVSSVFLRLPSRRESTRSPDWRLFAVGAALLAAWLAYQFLQRMHLPLATVAMLSQTAFELHEAAAGLSTTITARASLAADQTSADWRLIVAAAQFAMMSACLAASRVPYAAGAILMTIAGAAICQLGLSLLPDTARLLACRFEAPAACPNDLFGSYINRSHQGALLAMGFAVFAAYAWKTPAVANGIMRFGSSRGRDCAATVHDARFLLDLMMSRSALFVGSGLLLLAGLLSSASRAPVLCLLASCAIVGTYAAASTGRRARLSMIVLFAVVIGVGLFVVQWPSLQRLSWQAVAADERWQIWSACVAYFKDYWLWGSGSGSFSSVFPAYRSGTLRPLHYDHAHNDYLEWVLEQGLIGSVLFGLGGALLLYCAIFGRSHVTAGGHLTLAAALGCIAMLLHASVDFVFHVPANAMAFMMLLGCGLRARLWDWPDERRIVASTVVSDRACGQAFIANRRAKC